MTFPGTACLKRPSLFVWIIRAGFVFAKFWKRFIYFQYISLIVTKMSEHLFKLEIEKLEEGGFLATSSDVPGLVAEGRTIAETMEIAQDVAKKLIESYIEHGRVKTYRKALCAR